MTNSRELSCIPRSGTVLSPLSKEMWWSLGMAVSSLPYHHFSHGCTREIHVLLTALIASATQLVPTIAEKTKSVTQVIRVCSAKCNVQCQLADRRDRLHNTTYPARMLPLTLFGGVFFTTYRQFFNSSEASSSSILNHPSSSSAVLGWAPK